VNHDHGTDEFVFIAPCHTSRHVWLAAYVLRCPEVGHQGYAQTCGPLPDLITDPPTEWVQAKLDDPFNRTIIVGENLLSNEEIAINTALGAT
jgi:hypothetical protein